MATPFPGDFVDVNELRLEFVRALRSALEEADSAFSLEYSSAALVQRAVRGWRVRMHLEEHAYFARELQRVYRGHLARRRARQLLDARYAARAAAIRHYAAATLQRHFRGFYSRKHLHDFYSRKAFVVALAAKGDQLRAELDAHFQRQLAAKLEKDEAEARADFERTARGLHHLVSTAAQRGVWNPPYATRPEDVPSFFGVPLETHLRLGSLRHIRTHGLHPASTQHGATTLSRTVGERGLPVTASVVAIGERHATLVPAYVEANSRRTLQDAAPYDAVEVARREEAREKKRANLDQRAFVAGGRGRLFEGPQRVGVASETPFNEPWLNARSTREMEHLREKGKRVSSKPYVPASSRASQLFEESERRKAAFTVALLEQTVAGANPSLGIGAATGAPARSLNTTTSSVTIGNNTLRRGGGAGVGGGAGAGAGAGAGPSLTEAQLAASVRAQHAAEDAAAAAAGFGYSALPAGSAAAAVRRARSAGSGVGGAGAGAGAGAGGGGGLEGGGFDADDGGGGGRGGGEYAVAAAPRPRDAPPPAAEGGGAAGASSRRPPLAAPLPRRRPVMKMLRPGGGPVPAPAAGQGLSDGAGTGAL